MFSDIETKALRAVMKHTKEITHENVIHHLHHGWGVKIGNSTEVYISRVYLDGRNLVIVDDLSASPFAKRVSIFEKTLNPIKAIMIAKIIKKIEIATEPFMMMEEL